MFVEQKQLFHWRRAKSHKREVAYCTRVVVGGMLALSAVGSAQAAPSGGVVRDGSADISIGTDTRIEQFTKRVDIDWRGFDTTATESVTFDQRLGSSSVAINRISGARTQFDGVLNANGKVFLINQNGITFGSSAQVNVGSLLATTADTSIPFDGGEGGNSFVFSGDEGYGSVINNGNISVSLGGFAVLAAPYAENNGYIQAHFGHIELASTQNFTLDIDLRGDGLITYNVDPELFVDEEDGPLGVSNTGVLQSKSGHVYLTAHMASNVVNSVVNLDGVVDADAFGINSRGGTIMVASVGDINIGAGTDIHAVGGRNVSATFSAADDITMGEEGSPATITLKATDGLEGGHRAESSLAMEAGTDGSGSLSITGDIEVAAQSASDSYGGDAEAFAAADFLAADDISIAGDESVIRVAAHADNGTANDDVLADAALNIEAGNSEYGGDLEIAADIEVAADVLLTGAASASADAFGGAQLIGDNVTIDGNVGISATATVDGSDPALTSDANAHLAVSADGSRAEDGNLSISGDITVDADADNSSGDASATANAVLLAAGEVEMAGDIDVSARAAADSQGHSGPSNFGGADADANAALLMLGGAEDIGVDGSEGNLAELIAELAYEIMQAGGIEGVTPDVALGDGGVSFSGDISVSAEANLDAAGAMGYGSSAGAANATAAAFIGGGGDVFIDTDPVTVSAEANANHDTLSTGDSLNGFGAAEAEAVGVLLIAAGLGGTEQTEPVAAPDSAEQAVLTPAAAGDNGDLTILGDVAASARESVTFDGGSPGEPGLGSAVAVTGLFALGDLTIQGADPLASADPALVQRRSTAYQTCLGDSCAPVTAGIVPIDDGQQPDFDKLAQLIIQAGGDIRIEPKPGPEPRDGDGGSPNVVKVLAAYLRPDPIGPGWPGSLPLRFDAQGNMLVATGIGTTRPVPIADIPIDIEAILLWGGDPSKLLPPTAAGGCIAAARDAVSVSGHDFYDRLVSTACVPRE